MENFRFQETENNIAIRGKPDVEATKITFGNSARTILGDIGNLPQKGRMLAHNEKSKVIPIAAKECLDQLRKENLALMKILADRTKLIEVTRIELQKMTVNMQKMQQQNIQLAQSNSLMLVELNSGKNRLKALQHELGCKNGLLASMKLEVERRTEVKICEEIKEKVKLTNVNETKRCSNGGRDDDKLGKGKMRAKSKSLGPLSQVLSKDEIGNKRPCTRTQSARFKTEELKPPEDIFEVEDVNYSICQPIHDDKLPLKDIFPSTGLSHQDEGTEVNGSILNDAGTKRSCARRQSSRFKSEEPKPSEDEIGYKRPCTRRQSARFKTEELKPPENLFEVEDVKYTKCQPSNDDELPLKDVFPSTGMSHQNEGTDVNGSKLNDTGTKRSCARRQSSRFKSEEPKPSEDLFEINDAQFSVQLMNNNDVGENVSTCTSSPPKKEYNEGNPAPGYGVEDSRRSSLGRPLRQAAKKVHTYKEIPLNVKMRRCD